MNILYQTGAIYRAKDDNTKSYTTVSDVLIGTYPCRISRSSVQTIQGSPNSYTQGQMRAYFNIGIDIKEGDRLECDGRDYNITLVYTPGNHHIEADLKVVEVDV